MSLAKGSSDQRAVLRPGSPDAVLPPLRSPRLLDQVRERARLLHYSLRTEQAYAHWCRAFIRYHSLRHPSQMGATEVEAFLTWLVADRRLSASSHRQALSALLFLYSKVLGVQLPWMTEIGRPRIKQRLPVILSKDEVMEIFRGMQGEHRLFAQLLYGTGIRLSEGLRLRVKDLDFAHQAVLVRHGKGGKDRIVMLPQSLVAGLRSAGFGTRPVDQSKRPANPS
jgi:site-specific recombinase XerD